MLELEELDFSIPEFLPGTTIPTPANAGIQGNGLDNTLIGDRYDNVLNGGGGNDHLIGDSVTISTSSSKPETSSKSWPDRVSIISIPPCPT